jgi:hypothetical protein
METLMARPAAISIELRTKEVARRLLWGQSHGEIMGELGLTYAQFNHTISSPGFKETLRGLEQQAYQQLDNRFREELETVQSRARRESLTAVDTIIGMMKTSASENMKRDCANDIIRLAGEEDGSKRPIIQINQATFQLIQQAAIEDDTRDRTIDSTAEQRPH